MTTPVDDPRLNPSGGHDGGLQRDERSEQLHRNDQRRSDLRERGNDTLNGSSGDDYIDGGADNDYIIGDGGNDFLVGGNGNDTLVGDSYNDTIQGGNGNDWIIDGVGNTSSSGGDGDDTFEIRGGSGWDAIDGGTGTNDRIIFQGSPNYYTFLSLQVTSLSGVENIINNESKAAWIYGRGGLNLTGINLTNITGLRGDATDDVLTGNAVYVTNTASYRGMTVEGFGGNDALIGTAYNDTVNGGDGTDQISGLAGTDSLTGGNGADKFIFAPGGGIDTVGDFADGVDLFDVSATTANSIADFTGGITQQGANVSVVVDAGLTVIVQNTLVSNLTDVDFIF